jgi:hypothetical protein
MVAFARATDWFGPQVVAIKFDLPLTIEADAG